MVLTKIRYLISILFVVSITTHAFAQKVDMAADSIALNEVVVKATRKLVHAQGNGLRVQIDNTKLAKKGKLMDILPYMPFVSHVNGKIVVAGKGEPIFYLNGHRVYDDGDLEKLLASDIKDIEVITAPSAEYDASAKAVIKIRTKKKQGIGFSGNVESTICYLGDHLSEMPRSNINYRTGNFDFFGSLNLRDTRVVTSSERELSLDSDEQFTQNQTSDAFTHWLGYDGNVGLDFDCKNWNFGAKYAFTKTPSYKNINNSTLKVTGTEETVYDLALRNATTSDMLVQNVNAYVVYNLPTNTKLSAEWYFSKSSNDTDQEVEEHSFSEALPSSSGCRQFLSKSGYTNRLSAGKLELTQSFTFGDLKLGTEISSTMYDTNFENVNNNPLTPSASSKRKEALTAAYASFSLKSDVLMGSAGVRYEHCKVNYWDESEETSWSHENFFPFISLNKKIKLVNLGLSYTNKIRRPAYSYFRNNITYSTPFEYAMGYAGLKSTIFHTISSLVSYKNFSGSVSYEVVKNPIINMIRQYDTHQAVIRRPENVNTYKSLAVSGSWFKTIGIWTPYVTASWEKPFLEIDHIKYNHPTANVQLYNTFTTHSGYNFDMNFSFSSAGNEKVAKNETTGMMQLGVYKNFYHDNLYVGIYYMDVFNTLKDKYVINLENVSLRNESSNEQRGLYVTAIYKFNKTNSRYYGNKAGAAERSRL